MRKRGWAWAASALVLAVGSPVGADEGLWPLDRPLPRALRERHGFEPTAAWLEHLRKACVRFSDGGSGAFVSGDGLVATNHHVAAGELERTSTAERDLLASGFYAKTPGEELPCKELELLSLWSTEDVTDRVESAAAKAPSVAEAEAARRRERTRIEDEAEKRTGLDCQVEALWQGARHVLHCYRRYTDVRLVMAPERQVAFFGGDADNFEYPRYDLDVCFLRVYEGGKPLRPEHHLAWSASGAKEGDLALVGGHPGRTQRIYTLAHLRFLRDVEIPDGLRRAWRRESQLQAFGARSAENDRISSGDLFGVRNYRKRSTGLLAGLQDPAVLARKEAEEARLRAAVESDPVRKAKWADGWDRVGEALVAHRRIYERHALLVTRYGALRSDLYGIARHLVRLAEERTKPNPERLREYRDSELDTLFRELHADTPIHADLEVDRLTSGFSLLAENLGADDPTVAHILGGIPPRARAEALVRGSTLADPAVRKALTEGGKQGIQASKDPLVRLAVDLDPECRLLRRAHEDEVEARLRDGYAKIAAARFAVDGDEAYPDGTFTLRLAFGPIVGYREGDREVPAFTALGGLYERAAARAGVEGFDLPERWLAAKPRLDLATPFNFVCTADIIGGNSGSPVVDRAGEVVGLVFDSNLHGLVHEVVYTDAQARCVSVDSRAVLEALRKVYGAGALADELLRREAKGGAAANPSVPGGMAD
jgi:hypothetical protein